MFTSRQVEWLVFLAFSGGLLMGALIALTHFWYLGIQS